MNISDSVGGSISEYEEKMPDSAGGMMSEKVNMSDFFLLAVGSLDGYMYMSDSILLAM